MRLSTSRAGSLSSWTVVFALSLSAVTALLPATAVADAASDSLEQARAGAVHFRAKQFLEAARAFEHAYRLNPVDPRNLRYAGRAWQEVGHWERALSLLERYSQLESKPALRQSIQPRIDTLRATKPRQRAEQLALATVRFPQGKLEIDAARAYERLGTEADLNRAVKLYENARLWATSSAQQAQVDTSIDRLKGKLIALKNAPKGPQTGVGVGVVTPPVVKLEPKNDTVGTLLYVIGGVALVGGAGLGTAGLLKGGDATKNYEADKVLPLAQTTYKGDYAAYESDVETAKLMNIVGFTVAGVGGAVVLWAVIRGATSGPSPAAKTSWWVAPDMGGERSGMVVGMRF